MVFQVLTDSSKSNFDRDAEVWTRLEDICYGRYSNLLALEFARESFTDNTARMLMGSIIAGSERDGELIGKS